MNAPEDFMKIGIVKMLESRYNLSQALPLYVSRNNDNKADSYNSDNVRRAIKLLSQAYDEISAIWENDINV